jgi:oligopeptide transport system ATP-binding protein
MPEKSLLEVKNLRTIFNTDDGLVNAVNGVSFTLNAGETIGIVGESGCGKSVTCLSLLGLIPSPPGKVTGGEATFDGKEILSIPEDEKRKIRGKDISMIFQDPMTSLNPYLKISTQMTEAPMLHLGLSKKEALLKAIETLKLVGIPDPGERIEQYPHQFSGGMRQRAMIAMALTTGPKLLIADEPTTALDVTIQAQILELLAELRRKVGLSMILITHNLGVVAGMADRILVMYAGFVVEENTTGGLFRKPKHPYTEALLKSVPKLVETEKKELYTITGSPPNLVNLPDACPFYPRCPRVKDECRKKMPPIEKNGKDGNYRCYNPVL